MKNVIAIITCLLFFGCGLENAYSFQLRNKVDSLNAELEMVKDDTTRVNILNQLSIEIVNSDPNSALEYASESFELANSKVYLKGRALALISIAEAHLTLSNFEQSEATFGKALEEYRRIKDLKGEGNAYNGIGKVKESVADYPVSMENYKSALESFVSANDSIGIARSYSNIANINVVRGDIVSAIDYYRQALHIFDIKKDKSGLSVVYNNLAIIYLDNKDFDRAIEYYNKSLHIDIERNDLNGQSIGHNNIGTVYYEVGNFESALLKFRESLALSDSIKNFSLIGLAYHNIGDTYVKAGNIRLAKQNLFKSLKISKELNERDMELVNFNVLSAAYLKDNNSDSAIYYANMGIGLSKELGEIREMEKVLLTLSKAYEVQKNPVKALLALQEYHKIHESIYTEENNRAIVEMQQKYDAELKDREIQELNQNNLAKQLELEKSNFRNLLLASIIGVVIILLLITAFIFRQKQNANEKLEYQNEQINSQKSQLENALTNLQENNRRLDELNQEKDYLVNVVAHDLKSPMNQVKGLTDLIGMEEGKLTETQKDYLTKIQSAISRVTAMINKILDVGAIDLKLGNIQLEEKDINGILQKVIKNYAKAAAKKNIKINSSLKTDKSIVIVDKNYIFPVFENLISNAIKFSPHGKVISIKVKEINEAVQIFVTDEGPGIMKDELPKLFRKFQKLSAKPTGNETSTGLGLSIVKKYVEAMEGKVWYEPDYKPGAKFVVELKKQLSKGFAFSLFL